MSGMLGAGGPTCNLHQTGTALPLSLGTTHRHTLRAITLLSECALTVPIHITP